MHYKAYWIHAGGEIIPVLTTHIAEVIKTPELFGYTRERIETIYASLKEPIGHEGKARQIIMMDIIQNHGWIRLRYTPRSDSWVVETKCLTGEIRQLLHLFFRSPDVVSKHPHSILRITELDSARSLKNLSTSTSDLSNSNP